MIGKIGNGKKGDGKVTGEDFKTLVQLFEKYPDIEKSFGNGKKLFTAAQKELIKNYVCEPEPEEDVKDKLSWSSKVHEVLNKIQEKVNGLKINAQKEKEMKLSDFFEALDLDGDCKVDLPDEAIEAAEDLADMKEGKSADDIVQYLFIADAVGELTDVNQSTFNSLLATGEQGDGILTLEDFKKFGKAIATLEIPGFDESMKPTAKELKKLEKYVCKPKEDDTHGRGSGVSTKHILEFMHTA